LAVRVAQLSVGPTLKGIGRRHFAPNPAVFRSTLAAGFSGGYDPADKPRGLVDAGGGVLEPVPWNRVVCASDAVAEKDISEGMRVFEDFISHDEEQRLFKEVEPYLRRLRYEHDHWDDVSRLSA